MGSVGGAAAASADGGAEGTAAGIVGSLVLAAYAVVIGLVTPSALAPCVLAAVVATTVESLIGAAAQDGRDSMQRRLAWREIQLSRDPPATAAMPRSSREVSELKKQMEN